MRWHVTLLRSRIAFVVAGAVLTTAGVAHAAVVNIPAAAFPTASYLASWGVIEEDTAAVHRAPVYFPVMGQNVCRVIFWAHDFDANDVTVRLMRKALAGSTASFGSAPQTMASVSSNGAVDDLRAFSTTTITAPMVVAGYAYWVEVDFAGGPIQVAGVRIITAATCS